MSQVYQSISIQDLPVEGSFEGYYWYSNANKPEIIIHEPIQPEWFSELPFVVEANFFSREKNISIQVRHIDGQYQIALINLNNTSPGFLYDERTYLGHRLEGHNIKVLEAWQPEPDPYCENMPVLIPSWTAFVGFEKP